MAQKTRAQLQAQINSLLATNTAGDISATDVRTVDGDNIDSNLNLSDGGEMSGAITGNIAITGFRPIISTTSATINLLPGTHDGTFIYSNSAPAVTVNIFTKAITDFPLGTEIDIIQAGAGVVFDSDPQSEADETRGKAQAVISSIISSSQTPSSQATRLQTKGVAK